jgi:uncharacterized protein YcbK (DUF882 family)
MRASDLIETLRQMIDEHGDQEVWLGSDYGDICHTHQALSIEDVRAATLEDSAYSHSRLAVAEPDEEIEELEDEIRRLTLIRPSKSEAEQTEIDQDIEKLRQQIDELESNEDEEPVILITAYRSNR